MAERTPVVTAHLKCPGCGAGLTNDELGDIVCTNSGRPISQCALPAGPTDPDDPVGARRQEELERDVGGEPVLDEPGAAVPFHPEPDCPRCHDTGLIRGGPFEGGPVGDALCTCPAGEARAWEVRHG